MTPVTATDVRSQVHLETAMWMVDVDLALTRRNRINIASTADQGIDTNTAADVVALEGRVAAEMARTIQKIAEDAVAISLMAKMKLNLK